MRVDVATGGRVDESDPITILEESDGRFGVIWRFIPGRHDVKVIIIILVVVAGDLLLIGADRVGLDVGVEKTSSVAVVLERELGPESNFCANKGKSISIYRGTKPPRIHTKRTLCKIVSSKMRLEQRTHLRISRPRPIQDHEVDLEGGNVDAEWNEDKAEAPREPVVEVRFLWKQKR